MFSSSWNLVKRQGDGRFVLLDTDISPWTGVIFASPPTVCFTLPCLHCCRLSPSHHSPLDPSLSAVQVPGTTSFSLSPPIWMWKSRFSSIMHTQPAASLHTHTHTHPCSYYNLRRNTFNASFNISQRFVFHLRSYSGEVHLSDRWKGGKPNSGQSWIQHRSSRLLLTLEATA